MSSPHQYQHCRKARKAFTLVELLVVITVIVALASVTIPAFNSLKGAGAFGTAVSDIFGMVEESRAYALANDTYVYIGFFEEDGSVDSATPATEGVGRLVMAAVARKDGLRGYSRSSTLSDPAWRESNGSGYDGDNFVAISRLRKFDNVHLSKVLNGQTYKGDVPSSGNMFRPVIGRDGWENKDLYNIGHQDSVSVTPFSWPLDKPLGGGDYNFEKVIQISPQGVARVQTAVNEDDVIYFMEISLQESRNGELPTRPADQNVGQQAAIQISGMNGAATLYRP